MAYYVQFTFLEILFYFCTEMYQIIKKNIPDLHMITVLLKFFMVPTDR